MSAPPPDPAESTAGPHGRVPLLLTLAAALGIGVWLAATAVYRADDFFLVQQAWDFGRPWDAFVQWCSTHLQPRDDPRWPKFYRPFWHASYFVDAHGFGCRAGLSAAFTWSLHVATAWVTGSIVWRLTQSAGGRWFSTWVCLCAAAGSQAVLWTAARGTTQATLFTMLGVLVAISAQRATAARIAALCACIALAAGSNEAGIVAGPLIAWAIWILPRPTNGTTRRPIWIAALVATVAWILWRRFVLGCWVGGYGPVPAGDPLPLRALTALTSGTGAVALSDNATLPLALVCVVGGVVLVLLAVAAAAGERIGRGARRLALLALGAILLLLLPFAQSEFGDSDGTSGRSLYPAHAAWSLGVGVLAIGAAGPRRRWWRGLAVVAAIAATVPFVASLHALDLALQTARPLWRGVTDFRPETPVALFGMPDRVGPVLVARNAFPPAAAPPFHPGPTGVVGHATDDDLATGRVVGLALAMPFLPDVAAYWWNAESQRFEPGEWPTDLRWHGRVAVAADGTRTCSGVRIGADTTMLTDGAWYELRGELQGPVDRRELTVREATPWTPFLQPDSAARWRYRGQPNDYLFLLLGDERCVVGLGVAGTLGIARPHYVLIGATDATGQMAADLPAEFAAARLVQPVVVRGPEVFLGELHERP